MTWDDNVLNPERDNSLEAIANRYRLANMRTIAVSDAVVFTSLADIPKLIKRIQELESNSTNT